MTEGNIDFLISKYLSGQASDEEISKIESWAQKSPESAIILDSFRAIKNSRVKDEKFIFADRTFDKIERSIQSRPQGTYTSNRNKSQFLLLKIAAGFVFMALAIWIVYNFIYTVTPEEAYQLEYEYKSNPSGQRSMIYLPDGSTLWLNAESSIRYEKNFKDSARFIHLVGEAYFMVKKDAAKPFIVLAGNSMTTALGTIFGVKAYENDANVNIALENGLVKVQKQNYSENAGVLLHPGDMATVPNNGNQILISNYDPIDILAWKDGVIYFQNAQFDEVVHKLERWYGVKFHYDKRPSNEWHFTGTFRNEYLENILETLAFGERIDYKLQGNDVQLKF